MATRHVLTACLLCAGAAFWWLVLAPDPGVEPHEGAARSTLPPPASAPATEPSERPGGAAARTAPDAAVAGARVRLVVVNRADEPVAGAVVRYWPPRNEAAQRADYERREVCGDLETALQETGLQAITDDRGSVELVADPDSHGCARCGETYGEFDLRDRSPAVLRDVRVTLRRDLMLRVEVVDSSGRPAPGLMVTVKGMGVSADHGSSWSRAEVGPTDAEGMATLPHALHAVDLDERFADGLLAMETVRRDSDAHTVLLARRHVPVAGLQREATVRLTIPAGGTIVVSAKDADGAPFESAVWLRDENGEVFDLEPTEDHGEYTFRNVPCGHRWTAVVSEGGMMVGVIDDIDVPIVGPRTEEEVVRVAVEVPTRTWRLRCRLLRTDGRPLADAKLTGRSRGLDDDIGARGDDEGVVDRWYLREKATLTDLAPLELRIESPFCRPTTLVVARPIPSGTIDLGEFVVGPPIGEQTLARVELRAAGQPVPPGGTVSLLREDGERYDLVETWTSEVDGVIHLHGVPPRGPLLLSCWHPRFVSSALQPIRVGEFRVVDLQPAAALHVAVLATGLPLGGVSGSLARVGAEDSEDEAVDPQQQVIRWPQLATGRYRLRILLDGRVLHEAPAIDLLPGDNRWPADGTRIDLRGKVKVRRIAARSAGDEHRLDAGLLLVEAAVDTLPPAWAERIERGGYFLVPDLPHDVLVRASGHVPMRLPGSGPDCAIRMQPCTEVCFDTEQPKQKVHVRIVADTVTDPLLRLYDCHRHDAEFDVEGRDDRFFAPGTVLDVCLLTDGKAGPAQRVVVGTTSPQTVALR